jgi:hypothetical protein
LTEIEDLRIRVERLEQEIVDMKGNLLEYIDIDELSRKVADRIESEKLWEDKKSTNIEK